MKEEFTTRDGSTVEFWSDLTPQGIVVTFPKNLRGEALKNFKNELRGERDVVRFARAS